MIIEHYYSITKKTAITTDFIHSSEFLKIIKHFNKLNTNNFILRNFVKIFYQKTFKIKIQKSLDEIIF